MEPGLSADAELVLLEALMLAAPGLEHGQRSGAGTERDAEEQQRGAEETHRREH